MSVSSSIPASIKVSITRDASVKFGILSQTLVANTILIASLGLHFPADDAIRPLLITTILFGAALFYLRRREPGFVMCLTSLAFLVSYTAAYTVLMYGIAAIGLPLCDHWLIGFDSLLHVRIDHMSSWARQYPYVGAPLAVAYSTVIYQTAATVVVLGFTEQRRELEGFVMQFMLTTLICALLFVILPAEGPFVAYDYQPNAAQARFLNDLSAMRSGERTLVTWRDAEGLITCPSFHTTWAILLAWAFRHQKYLRWPMLILNFAVVASTMTTGWHYFADVVAGALLAGVGIYAIWRLEPWLYNDAGQPNRISFGRDC